MNNSSRYIEAQTLNKYRNNDWILNIYFLKWKESELVSLKQQQSIIERQLESIDQFGLSTEFKYFKTGFGVLHFGRRGVCSTIWHVGMWENTYEFFVNSWYCYQRDIDNMEMLFEKEPKFSHYEIAIVASELGIFKKIIETLDKPENFKKEFIKRYC